LLKIEAEADYERLKLYKKNGNTKDFHFENEVKLNPILNIRDMDDIWEKASTERSIFLDRMVIYCSKVIEACGDLKVVLMPFMTDKKGEVYWCYKPEIFGFHNRCVAQIVERMKKDFPTELFHAYDEVYKRGQGDTIEVPSRLKTSANVDPQRVGNKILFYICTIPENTEEAVDCLISKFASSLVLMQQHPEYLQYCLDKTFMKYGGKYTEVMKASMLNDKTFVRIMASGNIHVEKNIALYDITNTEGVRFIMNKVFKGNKQAFMTWSYAMKSFCFQNGTIPKGFF